MLVETFARRKLADRGSNGEFRSKVHLDAAHCRKWDAKVVVTRKLIQMAEEKFFEYQINNQGHKMNVRVYEHTRDSGVTVAPGRVMHPIWNRGDDLNLGKNGCPRTIEFRIPRKEKKEFYQRFQAAFKNRIIKSSSPMVVTMGKFQKTGRSRFLSMGNVPDAAANTGDAATSAESLVGAAGGVGGIAAGAVTLGFGAIVVVVAGGLAAREYHQACLRKQRVFLRISNHSLSEHHIWSDEKKIYNTRRLPKNSVSLSEIGELETSGNRVFC